MCIKAGCVAPPAGSDTRCLGHVDAPGLRALVTTSSPSQALDLRGKTIDAGLLDRMLAVAPHDDQGRPVLRSVLFGGATFTGPARFSGVAFHEASFDDATFLGDARFDGAVFGGQARFGRARFGGVADFAGARFQSQAWFSGAAFSADARFGNASFGGPAWFGGAGFTADALFRHASFAGDAVFAETRFGCHATFAETDFSGLMSLTSATFNHEARYDGARFRGPGGAPRSAAKQLVWAGAPLASWPARAGATLLDHAVPATLLLAALVFTRLAFPGSGMLLLALALVGGAGLAVHNLIEQGYTGQTFGKKSFGLCLVGKTDGAPVGAKLSLLRYGLHAVDTIPVFLGWLAPLWSPSRQTFADRIASTVVVRQRGWSGASPPRPSGVPASGFG